MSGVPPAPFFFKQPLRYLKWASINKPAYFYSIIVGCAGPVMLVTVPPFRRYLGNEQIPKIPMTYPGTYTAGWIKRRVKTAGMMRGSSGYGKGEGDERAKQEGF
jgi:hypothetical protein